MAAGLRTHLDREYTSGRITGPLYAEVFLSSINSVGERALRFLLDKDKADLEAQLIAVQIEKVQAEVLLATAQLAIANQQAANLLLEAALIPRQEDKLIAEAAMITQQTTNLVAEALNTPKQGLLIDAQKAVQTQQVINLVSEELSIDARTALLTQQTANGVIEGTVLTAQKCKLDAEFDTLVEQKLKIAQETLLIAQKKVTEAAQTSGTGIDAASVVGKQIALYAAQTAGFARDAEQKATKLMVDTWNSRRMTDDVTPADGTNKLSDPYIGSAVTKLLAGIGA
jgi:hypothetical protein